MATISNQLKAMGDNVKPGDPLYEVVTSQRMNAIMDAIRSLAAGGNLQSGRGIFMTRGPNGVIIRSTALAGGGGDNTFEHPFQIEDATDYTAETVVPTINVRYGTVNDVVPTDVATDVELTDDATNYVYLELTIADDGTMSAVELVVNTSVMPADDDTTARILLGSVVAASTAVGEINQAATHSLRFRTCDRVQADEEADPPVAFARGTYHFWGF